MLTLNNITYTKDKKNIVHDISCIIEPHKITALIGPNGSGKSTLLNIMAGLLQPNKGEILLQAHAVQQPLSQFKNQDLAQALALLPQKNPTPASLTVFDLVSLGMHPYRPWFKPLTTKDKEIIAWAMAECAIEHYADTMLSNVSGGELQRCWLAMILAQDTPVILLDEPTSWLDIPHQVSLLNIVKTLNEQYQKTVVWVLHDLNQARQYSHNALLLNKGELAFSGTAQQVVTKETIEKVYGITMEDHEVIGKQKILWPQTA